MTTVKLISGVMLVSLTLSAGLQVNLANLTAVLKNYGLLLRALLANFAIVPLLGVFVVRTFQLNPGVATGILLMTMTPGVPLVLQAAGRKKGGSLGFAVSLAAILPAVSIVTVPFTAALVLNVLEKSPLPVMNFIPSLVLFQLLPLIIGVLVAAASPSLAQRLAMPVLVIFVATLTVLLALLSVKIYNDVLTVYGSRALMASFCLVVLSLATGWLLGGTDRSYRRTLAIGTALRNVGLALLIATTSFPGSVAAAAVMAYMVVQAVVCSAVGVYLKRTAHSLPKQA